MPSGYFILLIVPVRYVFGGSSNFLLSYVVELNFSAVCILCRFSYFSKFWETYWPPFGKQAAHSVYDVFSWNKCLIFNLVCNHLRFWSGNLFLIASFPDHCILLPSLYYS